MSCEEWKLPSEGDRDIGPERWAAERERESQRFSEIVRLLH